MTDEETHAGPFTQGWIPAPTPLCDVEQKIQSTLQECGGLKQQIEQFKTVYREFNNLLCHIGYEGSVDADSRYVWDAMQALKKIDGGVYGEQFASSKRWQGVLTLDVQTLQERMETKQYVKVATDTGFLLVHSRDEVYMCSSKEIDRFAHAVQASERERCAQRIERNTLPSPTCTHGQDDYNGAIRQFAGQIRGME